MERMTYRPLILALALALSAPAFAQETEDEGRSLMEEGARLFWEGIRREMGPALEEFQDRAQEMEPALREFVEEMGPALRGLMDEVGDLSAYHAPEVLPNGDIIIRRKTPQELQDAPAPDGEIEL
ncbi:hypothetical protein SAMN04488077_10927 [Roseovarius tolerans]|uniref:AAA+ family ATPase n=1 Tax=Roseovarius tolerans TaxID=74031 RepID=A0A1H8C196_9RHOB|nr:hypothetical protein [Roseovarius tolerans]SEM87847.1 hypothetical protein SAMN04488077_10927 [Roseovarius tolerans]